MFALALIDTIRFTAGEGDGEGSMMPMFCPLALWQLVGSRKTTGIHFPFLT